MGRTWPQSPWVAYGVWSAALLAGTAWQVSCGHSAYDYRASARRGCTVLSQGAGECIEAPGLCLSAATVQVLSPRWLGVSVAVIGPVLTWLPLLLHAVSTNSRHLLAWLLYSSIAWLSLSMPLRFTHLATGWDPSGHVLLAGLQLVPTWMMTHHWRASAGGRSAWLFVAEALASALAIVTLSTASFFHTASEVVSAWLVVSAVLFAFHSWLHVDTLSAKAERRVIAQAAFRALVAATAVCLVSALIAFLVLRPPLASFLPSLAHDITLAATMIGVVHRMFHDHAHKIEA